MPSEMLHDDPVLQGDAMPLLRKARRLGLQSKEACRDEAVARGCFHYLQGRTPPVRRVSEAALTNAELALVLLGAEWAADPWLVRVGAMLLGAEDNDPVEIARLAKDEGCVTVVRHVAEAGRRYEPGLPFWATLLELLPPSAPPPEGVLPHPSRFVSLPGLIGPRAHGKPVWLRPRKPKMLGYAD